MVCNADRRFPSRDAYGDARGNSTAPDLEHPALVARLVAWLVTGALLWLVKPVAAPIGPLLFELFLYLGGVRACRCQDIAGDAVVPHGIDEVAADCPGRGPFHQ